MLPYSVRPMTEFDYDFILDSWLKNFRKSPGSMTWETQSFYEFHRPRVRKLLLNSTTLVAHPSEDQEHLLGYVTYAPGVLHYCYVKDTFRRMGVARELFRHAELGKDCEFTHWTEYMTGILNFNKTLKFRYNPYWVKESADGDDI